MSGETNSTGQTSSDYLTDLTGNPDPAFQERFQKLAQSMGGDPTRTQALIDKNRWTQVVCPTEEEEKKKKEEERKKKQKEKEKDKSVPMSLDVYIYNSYCERGLIPPIK